MERWKKKKYKKLTAKLPYYQCPTKGCVALDLLGGRRLRKPPAG